jgi:hypothetical protein
MPIHNIQKRRQYYRDRYHNLKTQKQKEFPVINDQVDQTTLIEPTKQEEPTTNSDKQYSNSLHKYTFKPIITIPNNNSSLDDVLNENATINKSAICI